MLRVRNQVDIEHGLLRLHELFRTTNFKMSHSSCQLVSLYKLHGVSAHLSCSAKVTAVLVEGALANAANDKELSRHDMKQKARQLGWKGNAKETSQDIFKIFQKTSCNPAISWLYHCISWYIQGSCSTGHIDKSRGPPRPYLKLETPRPFHQGGYLYWQYDRWGSLRPKWCKSLDGTRRGRCSFRLCL